MGIEGPGKGDNQYTPKKDNTYGVQTPGAELTTREGSCFPVNVDLSRRIVTRMTTGSGLDEERKANITPVLSEIGVQSPALIKEVFALIADQQQHGHGEVVAPEYLLGLTTAYSILHEQAKVNGTRLPSVSEQVMDAYMHDVDEKVQDEGDISTVFTKHVEELTAEDPGFMLPLLEYAPNPELDIDRFSFIASAIDTYDRIKRAEISDKMIREVGLGEIGDEEK